MLHATVLTALTRLGQGTARDDRAALAGTEPIVRPIASRKLLRLRVDAQLATRHADEAHVARLAALAWCRVPVLEPDDVRGVQSEFDGLPKPSAPRVHFLTIGVLALVVLGPLGGGLLYLSLRAFDPHRMSMGSALGPKLTRYEEVLSHRAPVTGERRALLRAARALDEEGTRSLVRLLDRAEAVVAGQGDEIELSLATRSLNAALAQKSLPFVLDSRIWQGKFPILYSFYIQREDGARSPGLGDERVLYVWRLDDLNVSKPVLGYTHRYSDAALVLLDQTEATLVADVLPSLADGERTHLVDDETRSADEAWTAEVETEAARVTREAFADDADAEALKHLGALLARRRAIVAQWKADLAGLHLQLVPPSRLIPEGDYTKELWIRVSLESRAEWTAIHDDLTSKATLATFERLRDRFAAATARHEVQHRLDAQRSPSCKPGVPCAELTIPERVRASFGPEDGKPAMLGTMAARISEETSAYLGEMIEGPLSPKMILMALSHFLFDRELWGDEYSNSAIILIETLAARVGVVVEPVPSLVARGSVRRKLLASWLEKLYAMKDDELRAGSRRSYAALFGAELPKATLAVSKQNQPWRH